MNFFNIQNAYNMKIVRGWDTIFWAIDFHSTICEGKYESKQVFEFYPFAKEVLQFLSIQEDTCLILYTCSHPIEIYRMQQFLKQNNILFKYVNCNPEVPNTALGNYKDKFYFNILLEDKSGFESSDWIEIKKILKRIYEVKI
ncbi:hypothetical protein GQ473_04255 [archaeon]|nr:hypothetical protein [archaeon]